MYVFAGRYITLVEEFMKNEKDFSEAVSFKKYT